MVNGLREANIGLIPVFGRLALVSTRSLKFPACRGTTKSSSDALAEESSGEFKWNLNHSLFLKAHD